MFLINSFSWIFDVVSSGKKKLPDLMLFFVTYIEFRTVEYFPHVESWLVSSNFRRGSRMQGTSSMILHRKVTCISTIWIMEKKGFAASNEWWRSLPCSLLFRLFLTAFVVVVIYWMRAILIFEMPYIKKLKATLNTRRAKYCETFC